MIVTESEKASLNSIVRTLFIWTIETVFNSVAGAAWGYFSEFNSTSFLELLWTSLLVYASVKAVFHLFPYWIGHRFLSVPNESIAHFVATQVGLFILISFVAGGIFVWNVFYDDIYLAVGMITSSVAAAFLFAYFEKKRGINRL